LDDLLPVLGLKKTRAIEEFYQDLTGNDRYAAFNARTNKFAALMVQTHINPEFICASADLVAKSTEIHGEFIREIRDKCARTAPDERSWQRRLAYILKAMPNISGVMSSAEMQSVFDMLGEKTASVFRIAELLMTLPEVKDISSSTLIQGSLLQALTTLWQCVEDITLSLYEFLAPELLFKSSNVIALLAATIEEQISALHSAIEQYWLIVTPTQSSSSSRFTNAKASSTSTKASSINTGVKLTDVSRGRDLEPAVVSTIANRPSGTNFPTLNASESHRANTAAIAHVYISRRTQLIVVTLITVIGWYANVRTDVNWAIFYQRAATVLIDAIAGVLGFNPTIGWSVAGLLGGIVYYVLSLAMLLTIGSNFEIPWWAQITEYVIRQMYAYLPLPIVSLGYIVGWFGTLLALYNFVQTNLILPQQNQRLREQVEELQQQRVIERDSNIAEIAGRVQEYIMDNIMSGRIRAPPLSSIAGGGGGGSARMARLMPAPAAAERSASRDLDERRAPRRENAATSSTMEDEDIDEVELSRPAPSPTRRQRAPRQARGESPPEEQTPAPRTRRGIGALLRTKKQ